MEKFKYLIKRISSINVKKFFQTINRISKKANRNRIIIFFDIVYCGIVYMAGYVDYETFEMYNMTREQRKTVITRGINNQFVKDLNNPDYAKYIDDKILFNKKYNQFLKREWIDIKNENVKSFEEFLQKHKEIITKPTNLSCGEGVEKIEYNENLDIKELFNKLLNNKQYLIEEVVTQHDEMNKLNFSSVNTIRVVTILSNKKVYIPFTCIRIGNNGNVMDNFNHGGLLARINKKGIIEKEAIDKKGNVYYEHPYTKTKIVGFKIPLFNEVLNFAKELAMVTPEIRYTGWDIAITEKGPVVIEGNPFPGHDLYQPKIHVNKGNTGMLPEFKKILWTSQT